MFFSYTRTALKVILLELQKKTDKNELLVPNYICNTLVNHIKSLDISIIYYDINENLEIDINNISSKINNRTIGLVIVNYFGFPLHLEKAKKISEEYSIKLIEDNSHGYKGIYKSIEMGNHGDYGFSSPRKHLPLPFGGVLHGSKNFKINFGINYKFNLYDFIRFKINKNFLNHKLLVLKFFKTNQTTVLKEKYLPINDSLLDKTSLNIIENTMWDELRKFKMNNFKNYLNNLRPSFNNSEFIIEYDLSFSQVNPWCLPVLFKSEKEALEILNWAKSVPLIAFSWPTLPNNITKNSIAYEYSRRLVCFSTYTYIK